MIPAWLIQMVEALAYGASRGYWKAKMEFDREGVRATTESATNEDNVHIRNFRASVDKLRGSGASDPGSEHPASTVPPSPSVPVGGKT